MIIFEDKVKAKVISEFDDTLKEFKCDGKWYRAGHNKHVACIGTEFEYKGNFKKFATIKSFKTGERYIVRSWTDEEETSGFKKVCGRAIALQKQDEEKESERVRGEAKNKIKALLDKSKSCITHPYLDKKGFGLNPIGDRLRISGQCLFVPAENKNGEVVGCQFIHPDGQKNFLKGSVMSGSFFQFGGSIKNEVILCEGLATGLSMWKALNLPVVVYFYASNLEAVADNFKEKKIIVGIDNDASKTGLKEFDKTNRKSGYKLIGVMPPDEGMDWNDYDYAHGSEKLKLKLHEKINKARKSDLGQLHFLGYSEDTKFIYNKDHKVIYKFNTATKQKLMDMLPRLDFWGKFRKIKEDGSLGSIDWDNAGCLITELCIKAGNLKEEEFKASGVHKVKDEIFISSKEGLFNSEGKKLENIKQNGSVFLSSTYYKKPSRANMNKQKDFKQLVETLYSFCWEHEDSALALASWLPISLVGGALDWRPHLWIFGDTNSGKSSTLKFVNKLLNGFSISLTKGTTQAGLKRIVNNCTNPVVFDEFESDNQEQAKVIQDMLMAIRNSNSSGFNAVMADRNSTMNTISLNNLSCFLLGSINVCFESQADRDRILCLKLDKSLKDIRQYNKFMQAINKVNFKSLINNLWAESLDKVKEINLEYNSRLKEIKSETHKDKLFCMLQASAKIFYGMSLAKDLFKEDHKTSNSKECLSYILNHVPHGSSFSVYDFYKMNDKESLRRLGLSIYKDYLFVANSHPYLKNVIFRNTPYFYNGWSQALNSKLEKRLRISGIVSSGILIRIE